LNHATAWKCSLNGDEMKRYVFILILAAAFFSQSFAQETLKVEYVEPTVTNVSNVLFRKGVLKTDDPAAMEEYIRLHECGLYEQYANDDFAWARIRDAYARDLGVRLNSLPDGLEIVSALPLGQYDLEKFEFPIDPAAQMDQTGFINAFISKSGSLDACSAREVAAFVPRVHPLDLTIKMDKPLTLKAISMDQAAADAFILSINKRIVAQESQRRQATLVLRVRLTNADPLTTGTDPLRRTVLGLIDDLRVYDGPNRDVLLYRVDYQTQREKEAASK
jgi:hypothetical protein